jgi:DNA-binding transcriptional MerR regulator
MDQGQYLIDELCRLSGFSRRTIRYYVQEGLVDPPAARGRGGFYSEVQLRQLARIKELQERGYRLEAIRGLLTGEDAAQGPAASEGWRQSESDSLRPSPSSPGVPKLPGPDAPHAAWTRIAIAPGVELHVSAEAERRLGPAVATALKALRSIIQKEGGSNE